MRAFYTVLLCIFFIACGDDKKGDSNTYLPSSIGDLNNLSIVVDNTMWEESVGESIRNIFAAPLNGLPTEEPMFKLHQIPPQIFDSLPSQNRILLKIETKDTTPSVKITNNVFAKPQTVVVVNGRSNEDIIAQLKENKAKIIDALNKEEVKEKQRLIRLSLLDDKEMEDQLGFTINIPSVYRIAKGEESFFWIRKNLSSSKTVELMFYEVPFETISEGDSTIVDIVKMRNKITKTKIPGEDDIYMAVENAYTPFMFKTIIDNKPTYEVRGLWEMQGFTMAGPFITYAIEDKVNKRYLIADGYVYAPSLDKGQYIFELESIIKSIKIK